MQRAPPRCPSPPWWSAWVWARVDPIAPRHPHGPARCSSSARTRPCSPWATRIEYRVTMTADRKLTFEFFDQGRGWVSAQVEAQADPERPIWVTSAEIKGTVLAVLPSRVVNEFPILQPEAELDSSAHEELGDTGYRAQVYQLVGASGAPDHPGLALAGRPHRSGRQHHRPGVLHRLRRARRPARGHLGRRAGAVGPARRQLGDRCPPAAGPNHRSLPRSRRAAARPSAPSGASPQQGPRPSPRGSAQAPWSRRWSPHPWATRD